MKHYSEEELEMYRNGQMSVLNRITCASHLQDCAECKKILEELKEDDQFIAELRSSIQQYRESSQN